MIRRLVLAVILTAIAGMATGTEATQQTRGEPRKGDFCVTRLMGAHSVYDCQYLGKVTIKQMYEKGWRIGAVLQQDSGEIGAFVTVVIEEQ
jgi:hypothetical protein